MEKPLPIPIDVLKAQQIDRQLIALRAKYDPNRGSSQFTTIAEYYPDWNKDDPQGSLEVIAAEHRVLWDMLTCHLPTELQPTLESNIFNNYTILPFKFGKNIVYPQVHPWEVSHRINDVIGTVGLVTDQAEMGNMNEQRAMIAARIAAVAFMGIHGVIGRDGNGRAFMSLMKPIVDIAKLSHMYSQLPFMKEGQFNLKKALALMLIYDKPSATCLLAAVMSLVREGLIPQDLYNPKAIVDDEFNSKTNTKAKGIIKKLLLHPRPLPNVQRPVV